MEIEIPSLYVNAESVENKERCLFLDEGALSEGKFGKQYNFKVLTASGKELVYTPTNTALRVLMKAFGKETKKWVSKSFYAEHVQMIVRGERKTVIVPVPCLLEEEQVK